MLNAFAACSRAGTLLQSSGLAVILFSIISFAVVLAVLSVVVYLVGAAVIILVLLGMLLGFSIMFFSWFSIISVF